MTIKKINPHFSNCSGVSFVELAVVLAIIAIMSAVAVVNYSPLNSAYKADDTSIQVMRFMREGTNLAAAQRRTMRVEIDSTKRTISLYNQEGTVSPTDDVLVVQEPLPSTTDISLSQPTGIAIPAAPYNYTIAAYDSTTGIWKGYFQGDGTITDTNGVPLSATFFFSPPGATNTTANKTEVRALTIFGPSGAIKIWKYRSGTLQTGVN